MICFTVTSIRKSINITYQLYLEGYELFVINDGIKLKVTGIDKKIECFEKGGRMEEAITGYTVNMIEYNKVRTGTLVIKLPKSININKQN